MMKVLVVGSGGREHAFAWKIAQSPLVKEVYAAPGNAGTSQIGKNLPIKATDIKKLGDAALNLGINLVIVGPEAPLALGIADHFQKLGIPLIGPTQSAAQIEASKVFARRLMMKYNIPCPKGEIFSSYQEAYDYVNSLSPPIVVKADGLAGGKGVVVAQTKEEALKALYDIMEARIFGDAGRQVIIDECLFGREVSLIAFTDGKTVVPMVPARDYKRVFDGDKGPNTGGMGGYSPPSYFTPDLAQKVKETILQPAVEALAKEGRPYKGVLYAGLMLTQEGPKVLEFNCRCGDPENQVILPRLKSDLVEIFLAIIENRLEEIDIEWDTQACVGVVMASGGYPGSYQTGFPIYGLDKIKENVLVFHAGTRKEGEQIYTDGGRVLTVVAKGDTIPQARAEVYKNLPLIYFEGCHYRKDIAAEEV